MGPAIKGGFSSQHKKATQNGSKQDQQTHERPSSKFKPSHNIQSDKIVSRKQNEFKIEIKEAGSDEEPNDHFENDQIENGDVGSSNSVSAMSIMAQRPTKQDQGSSGQNNSNAQANQATMTFEKENHPQIAISGDQDPSVKIGGSNEEPIELHHGPNTSNADYDTDQQLGPNLFGIDNQETVSEQIHAKKYSLVQDKSRLKWSQEFDQNSQFSASKTHAGYIENQNQFEGVSQRIHVNPILKKSSSNVLEKSKAVDKSGRLGFQLVPLKALDQTEQDTDLERKFNEIEIDEDIDDSQEAQNVDMVEKSQHPLQMNQAQAVMQLPAFGKIRFVDKYSQNVNMPQTHAAVLNNSSKGS